MKLLLAFALCGVLSGAHAATLLQNATVVCHGSGSTWTRTLTALTLGSKIVAVLTIESSSITLTSIADTVNTGNYTVDAHATQPTGTDESQTFITSIANISSATTTVTATVSASIAGCLKVYEVSGLATASAVDATAVYENFGGTGTPSTFSLTTAATSDTIIVGTVGYGGTFAVDSGFTEGFAQASAYSEYHWGEYRLDSGSPQTYTLTMGLTMASMTGLSAAAVAYKAAGVAPAGKPQFFF